METTENKITNSRIIIEGDKVHLVGYRPFLLAKASRLGIKNFDAENVEEKDKQRVIACFTGDEKQTLEFIKYAENNFPKYAEGVKVSTDTYPDSLEIMLIGDYQKILSAEQQDNVVQGGMKICEKIDTLIDETDKNFKKMDDNFRDLDRKYKLISEGMFAVVNEIKDANKLFEERIEKTEKSIESLLNILVQQKK